jgi:hypothetical protein
MSKRISRTVGRRSAHTGTFAVVHHVEQHPAIRLLGGVTRLRAELATITVLAITWWLLDAHVAAGMGAWLILAGFFVLVAAWPRTRRLVTRRVRCVVTRHQLRASLVGSGVMTHEGRLPRLLWARPTPVGEQVWLWMRPGLSGRHLERITDELASGCWAREVRVHVHPRWTVLVRVETVRHDPLHGDSGIDSDLMAGRQYSRAADVIPLPDRATVAPRDSDTGTGGDTAAPTPTTASRPRSTSRTRARNPESAPVAEPEVTGRSGEDVTDYV